MMGNAKQSEAKAEPSAAEAAAPAEAGAGASADETSAATAVSAEASEAESPESELSTEALQAKLTAAEAEAAELREQQEQLLRTAATAQNLQRRAEVELEKTRKFALEGFARELLGVKDSLEQAGAVQLDEAAGEAVRKMREGLQLTAKQLDAVFARFGVVQVKAAVGVAFDPEVHQAIATAASDEVEAGAIVEVMQTGFLLHGRLLRAAMVVVTP